MTPEEAKAYVLDKCTMENWKSVQIDGKYYRQTTLRRGEGKDTWSMTQLVEDKNDEEMQKFFVNGATTLKQMMDSGIVK